MTILELREKRAKAWEAAKAFLDSHRNEKGVLSAEDDAAYTRMEQDITDLGREIARLERQEALDAELSKPTTSPLTGKPLGGAEQDEPKTGRASKAYKEAMLTALRTNFRQVSNVLQEGIDLVYALKRPYRKSAAFLTNDQTLAVLRKLKDNNGQYLWQPSYQAGEPDRLFGYAIHTSPYFPTVTAGKPAIAFGDFSYYNIGDRGTRSFAELKELFAGNGMVGFVAKERVDGKLVLPEAVQLLAIKAASK